MPEDHNLENRAGESGPGSRGVEGDKGPIPVRAANDDGRRPTPVRQGLETGAEEEGRTVEEELRTVLDPVSGQEWIASVAGRSGSGILPIRSVPVMEVVFSHPENPGNPLRRAVEYGRDLDQITDQELLAVLGRAVPYGDPLKAPPSEGGKGRRSRKPRPRRP